MLSFVLHALLFDTKPSDCFISNNRHLHSIKGSPLSKTGNDVGADVITIFSTSASSSQQQLSDLPIGISPFERTLSKSIDVQADFRNRAKPALEKAIADGIRLMEIEFPPLIGGDKSKNQFDDFDNIQELEKNKDWAMQFAPMFMGDKSYCDGKTWLVFPDLKECEIAKKEWTGARYRESTFTTIEAATNFLSSDSYDAPWGAAFMSGVSKMMAGDDKKDAGLLGDLSSLDDLEYGKNAPATMTFIIQPGNGGPVEDWINCEKIFLGGEKTTSHVIINGALDKVRAGYYPAVFFPKLAATVDRFFNKFESVFYLKPCTDKGVYGWLYRVYPGKVPSFLFMCSYFMKIWQNIHYHLFIIYRAMANHFTNTVNK